MFSLEKRDLRGDITALCNSLKADVVVRWGLDSQETHDRKLGNGLKEVQIRYYKTFLH